MAATATGPSDATALTALTALSSLTASSLFKSLLQKLLGLVKSTLTLGYEQDLAMDLQCFLQNQRNITNRPSQLSKVSELSVTAASDVWQEQLIQFYSVYPSVLGMRLRLKMRAFLYSGDFAMQLRSWVSDVLGGIPLAGPVLTHAASGLLSVAVRAAVEAAFGEVVIKCASQQLYEWFLLPAIETMRSYID